MLSENPIKTRAILWACKKIRPLDDDDSPTFGGRVRVEYSIHPTRSFQEIISVMWDSTSSYILSIYMSSLSPT